MLRLLYFAMILRTLNVNMVWIIFKLETEKLSSPYSLYDTEFYYKIIYLASVSRGNEFSLC